MWVFILLIKIGYILHFKCYGSGYFAKYFVDLKDQREKEQKSVLFPVFRDWGIDELTRFKYFFNLKADVKHLKCFSWTIYKNGHEGF